MHAPVCRGAQLSLHGEQPAAGLMARPIWPHAARTFWAVPAPVTRQRLRKSSVAFAPKGSVVLKKTVVEVLLLCLELQDIFDPERWSHVISEERKQLRHPEKLLVGDEAKLWGAVR